mgnify:CR=1 FL=1
MTLPMKMLNVGCGNVFHPDWVNADLMPADPGVMRLDVTEPWPFETESFDVVYSSHVLEHLYPHQASHFLSEARRVLRPGGTIRLAVPDLERIAQTYLRALADVRRRRDPVTEANYDWMVLELLDQMVRQRSGGMMAEFLSRPDLPNESFILERVGLEAQPYFEENRPLREALDSMAKYRGNRPLAVFGAGSLGQKVAGRLKALGYRVDFFVDNDPGKHGRDLDGLPILAPSRVHEAYVVVASAWADEIRRQLVAAGRKEREDFVCISRLGGNAGETPSPQGELHRWMYDSFSLGRLLENHGFEDIAECTAFSSRIPQFERYQLDTLDGRIRKPDSLYMEASKTHSPL